MEAPLLGKKALITGVSRRRGIGYAVARELAGRGASVFCHHYRPHDVPLPTGADDLQSVFDGVRQVLHDGAGFGELSADLAADGAPERVVEAAWEALGGLDILICNHARSGSDGSMFDMDAATLDSFYAVNTRSTILLTKEFAARFASQGSSGHVAPGESEPRLHFDEHSTGRVIWFTSGQLAGPMPGEIAYAASKAALAGVTSTAASELLRRGIVLNTVNPGPVNTGYLNPETADRPVEEITEYVQSLPMGRFGAPEDPARLIAWLVSDEARWVVGEVISSEGGFRL